MTKKLLTILLLIGAGCLAGCTENSRARNFGGTSTMQLPTGRKLVTVTWKETSMWILTRPRREGEPVETYEFKEDSGFGLVQGTVIIKEQ